jgi:aspartate ammonia-lyase
MTQPVRVEHDLLGDRAVPADAYYGIHTLRAWDVNRDSVTEHDRRHATLREYVAGSTPNNREVARAIRPHIEAFLRVACPEHFPPGTLLGPFRSLCQQRMGTAQQMWNTQTGSTTIRTRRGKLKSSMMPSS